MLPRGNNKEVMTAITLCSLLYIDHLIKKKKKPFLFLSTFRFTEKLQRWYKEFPYILYSVSLMLISYITTVHISKLRI